MTGTITIASKIGSPKPTFFRLFPCLIILFGVRVYISAVAVALVAAAAYLNSLPGHFFYDDYGLMLENPDVTRFSYLSFLENYGGRPLTLWTFYWNEAWFGDNPLPYHLINVLLHALVSGLVVLVVRRWSGRWDLALVTAVIFALHPLQTQAVNYVWARSVLLMGLFALLAVRLAPDRLAWSLVVFQLAIWSRAEAAVLLIPLWMLNRKGRPYYLAIFLLNVLAFTIGYIRHAPAAVALDHPDPWHFFSSQPFVIWRYVGWMVWPFGLSIDHGNPDPGLLLSLVLLGLLAASAGLAWHFRGSFPFAAYGWLWCLLWLLPACLIPNAVYLSEYRTYVAIAGFSIVLARGLLEMGLGSRLRMALLGVVLVGMMATQIIQRNRLWNDELAIWQEAVTRAPQHDRVRYNLGFALARKGRIDEAEREFRTARDLNPKDDFSYAALAYCSEVKGDLPEAKRLYSQALGLNPDNAYAAEGLSRVQLRLAKGSIIK